MAHQPPTSRIWGVETPKPVSERRAAEQPAAPPTPAPVARPVVVASDGASIPPRAIPPAPTAPLVTPTSAPPLVVPAPRPAPSARPFGQNNLARLVADGPPEPAHGVTLPAPQVSIASHPDPERVLAQTRDANQARGLGATMVPGTRIELLNFAPCPRCDKILSQGDLYDHYGNPPSDLRLERKLQMRRDVRACCTSCGAFFFPSLLVIEGPDIREVQYLSRVQVVDAIELYMRESLGREVLTRNRETMMMNGRLAAIRVDIALVDIAARPALVSNLLQHTPRRLAQSLLAGTNMDRQEPLFGAWFPARSEKGARGIEEMLAAA